MSAFWNPRLFDLRPYTPGEQPRGQEMIKLNTNENPYPPSPRVLAALVAALQPDGGTLRLYPDPDAANLKAALARHYRLSPAEVFVGNGSDEVLAFVFLALLKQSRPLLFPDITYSFYPSYCRLYEIEYQTIPLAEDFSLDLQPYLARSPKEAGGIIFPNPNAPTGRALPLSAIAELARRQAELPIVIDEAYVDFGAETAASLIHEYPNLLVTQTFSKSRALAGLRVGFALGDAALIEGLERVKNSFNSYPLDRLAQAGALAALEDASWFEHTRRSIMRSRERLTEGLSAQGLIVLPSLANFIFARHPARSGAELLAALKARHILARRFDAPRIYDYLRISIGTEKENDALLRAFADVLSR
ncbi:MAG: histidinol-phosphate transaminase [Zoogloeaceae bacterium]|jgi:histidinol-phosphate aminotransferase|nr:histidinol-phosphate transaminase [Zoogloeaceae bacterium]